MPVQSLGGVFVRVTNLENSIAFYERLGLKLRGIEEWDPGRGATFFLGAERESWPLLTLVEIDQVRAMEHPAFNLVSTEVKEMHRDLELSGYKVTPLEEWSSSWNHHLMFDVHDPDGHPINIIKVTPVTVTS